MPVDDENLEASTGQKHCRSCPGTPGADDNRIVARLKSVKRNHNHCSFRRPRDAG